MKRKGTYVLFINLPRGFEGEVGSLGSVSLPPGNYCYVGSAMGGLDQRVGRHISDEKTIRWHIDRLTVVSSEKYAMEHEGADISECDLGKILEPRVRVCAVRHTTRARGVWFRFSSRRQQRLWA